jgi:hypothetical protein
MIVHVSGVISFPGNRKIPRHILGVVLVLLTLLMTLRPFDAVRAGNLAPVPEELLARCRRDPTVLRKDGTYRDFRKYDMSPGYETFRNIAADSALPPDIRARALLLLPYETATEQYLKFGREFSAVTAARTVEGAAAINFLSREVFGENRVAALARELILPGPDMKGVGTILQSLSGQACHDYLHMLYAREYPFQPEQIRLLAATPDEATRRFLYWYVSKAEMAGMERFLAREIASAKPSTYGGRWMRLVLMAFTAGVSELMRAALPPPDWLDDDKTTREVALESLARLVPAGTQVQEGVLKPLLDTARESAASDEEEDYRLAAAVLMFLHDRAAPLEPGGRVALAALARLVPDEDARNETFVLAVKVHQRTGLPLPTYSQEEVDLFWDRAQKTLNHEYLAAVVAVWPDSRRRAQLTEHLLEQGAKAARGNLRFPAKNETWLCVHDAGDWSRCVAALKVEQALPLLAGVLQTSWADDAARALMTFGPAGLPPLKEFMVTSRAGELMGDERRDCIRFCIGQLTAREGADFARALLDNPPTRRLVREVLQDMGPHGSEVLALLDDSR